MEVAQVQVEKPREFRPRKMRVLCITDGEDSSATIVMRDYAKKSRHFIDVRPWNNDVGLRALSTDYDLVYLHSGILLSPMNTIIVDTLTQSSTPWMAGLRGMLNYKRWLVNSRSGFHPWVGKLRGILCSNLWFLARCREMSKVPSILAPSCVDPDLFQPLAPPMDFSIGFVGHPNHGAKGYEYFNQLSFPKKIADGSIAHSDMPNFYKGISVYCCTSVEEGAPVPPKEAASSARPVVSFDVGDIRDWLPERLIVRNIPEMEKAVHRLRQNAEWHRAANECWEAVEPYYSVNIARVYDSAFESINNK